MTAAGMTKLEFDALQGDVGETFSALYLIDVTTLTPREREMHQKALSEAYLALIRLENARFAELGDRARVKLAALASRATLLRGRVADMQRTGKLLDLVAAELGVFSGIVKLLA